LFLESIMSMHITNRAQPIRHLTRLEQLTLNTWRWAAVAVGSTVHPSAILELAGLHAVLAALRDVDDPKLLFSRHAHAQPEFQLVLSVLPDEYQPGLAHDILDTAFLLRWTELVSNASGPPELAPSTSPESRARSVIE
jgi:hypothetical protein